MPVKPIAAAIAACVAASVAEVAVVGRAWEACDVGVNASANALTLLFFGFPLLLVAHAVVLAGAAVVARRTGAGPGVQAAVTGAGVVAVAAVVLVFVATPGGVGTVPTCPGGEPSWWPGWLPS